MRRELEERGVGFPSCSGEYGAGSQPDRRSEGLHRSEGITKARLPGPKHLSEGMSSCALTILETETEERLTYALW